MVPWLVAKQDMNPTSTWYQVGPKTKPDLEPYLYILPVLLFFYQADACSSGVFSPPRVQRDPTNVWEEIQLCSYSTKSILSSIIFAETYGSKMALSSLLILLWAELQSMSLKKVFYKEFYKKMPNLLPMCLPGSLVLSWPSSMNGCAESCAESESVRFDRINCSAQVYA